MADGPRVRRTAKKGSEKKGKKKMNGKKLMIWLFFTGALAVICGIIGYLLIVLNGERILAANWDKMDMEEASIVYDINGDQIAKLASVNREIAEYDEIPQLMKDAFIATEDRRFEEHNGVDLWSIGRAVVKDVIARSAVEGGSTITQQLAKNLFLTHDKTFFRKATEASIAVALEHKKTKDEILTMYLNRIFFGNRAYGVKAAAKVYFDRELKDLELWQIATLAGLPKAPSAYNPIRNPERSRERMAVVLQLMTDQKYITAAQAEETKAKALAYEPPASKDDNANADKYWAFVDYAIEEAAERVPEITEEQLYMGGYSIYTTLNPKAQSVMEKEFADADNFEKSVDEQLAQGAMVILDHSNGNIQGLVGGRDYVRKGWNRAVVQRQPGSGFKPITVYGPALATGDWFPWSTVMDEKKCYGDYCPTDSNKNKYIGAIPISQSIKESRNASAVWLLNEIGVKTGLEFAKKLGFELDEAQDRNLAIALGGLTHGVTPLQMATAYSVFANGGMSVDAHALVRIVDKTGAEVYTYEAPKAKRIMSEQSAWYMTEIMQAVLEKGGTGTQARIDRPVAGKTGTTQHGIPNYKSSYNRDAWFTGYTAEWTAAVWMGYDKTDKEHLLKKSSSQAAAMFGKVMKAAMKGMPVNGFNKPKDVEEEKQPVNVVGDFKAAYDAENKMIRMSWTPVDGEGMTYRVYRKEASETEFKRLMDALDGTEVNDMSIAPGLTFEYYVTAYNPKTDVESGASAHLTIAIPEEELEPIEPVEQIEPENPDDSGTQGNGTGENTNGTEGDGTEGGTDDGLGGEPGVNDGTGTNDGTGANDGTGTNDPSTDPGGGQNGGGTNGEPPQDGNAGTGTNGTQGDANGSEGNGTTPNNTGATAPIDGANGTNTTKPPTDTQAGNVPTLPGEPTVVPTQP
ncbi:PBP1A family penicillin-binding protein [Paenibacillus methanolicus]|uniref:Penicillin-binding protein 2A n=1 Tax=Paenibacillus methanolicus TaxID=582686 RepID=A0A5S5C1T4_9BACL|nr:PBP1A family penicillin-binding protein [Paenibacillus methanolicus]TYP72568.1 penicillin-binding protein 2A [Paenibacillus methanolicus]